MNELHFVHWLTRDKSVMILIENHIGPNQDLCVTNTNKAKYRKMQIIKCFQKSAKVTGSSGHINVVHQLYSKVHHAVC